MLNNTELTYRINSLHLIKIDCEREVASGGKIIKEYLQTTFGPVNSSETPSNYWLDSVYPARVGTDADKLLYSTNEIDYKEIYNDSPKVFLEDEGVDVRYVKARMYFYFFILALPDITGGVRFPIGKRVSWYWSGAARKNSDSTWSPVDDLDLPPPEQLDFHALPGWSNISTGTKPLKWLQKE